MEYGLRGRSFPLLAGGIHVLILVLMEYGLREGGILLASRGDTCLNPCFNGIWSASDLGLGWVNPISFCVLILVLMEYGLRATMGLVYLLWVSMVLILVLMEYGLRERVLSLTSEAEQSLNPCFNGIWSARAVN